MKKLVALILAVVMVLACSISVFADTVTPTGDGSKDVKSTVVDKNGDDLDDDDDDIPKVYHVVVEWDSMEFTFKAEQAAEDLIWDSTNHKYSNLTGEWQNNTGRKLTLTNHSNATVGFAANFENGTKTNNEKHGVTSALTGTDGTLATAVGTLPAEAPNYTYTVAVSGIPTVLEIFTVDTITVTLSK